MKRIHFQSNNAMKTLPVIIAAAALLLAGCSNIAENERLVYVEPKVATDSIDNDPVDPIKEDSIYDAPVKEVPQRVLIEDHTGQKCPNCPAATNVIHELQETYGSLIVPVAIHSQSLGIMEEDGGLGNELGNAYYNHWGIRVKPSGLVNRLDGGGGRVLNTTIWPVAVQYALTMNSGFDVRVKAIQDATDKQKVNIDVKVLTTRADASFSGNLQVWLTEDNIIARQDSMGTEIANYKHNHVLRAAVNGNEGVAVDMSGAEQTQEFHYELPIKAAWNINNLSIVAFIYSSEKVEQVIRRAVTLRQ